MEEVKIGIVAEGISDYWVIKHIVERFLKDKGASLECWLIPFVSDDRAKCSKVDNCINAVNNEIRSEGTIDKNNKGAAIHLYNYILAKKKKPKEIQDISKYNVGFSKFIESLILS